MRRPLMTRILRDWVTREIKSALTKAVVVCLTSCHCLVNDRVVYDEFDPNDAVCFRGADGENGRVRASDTVVLVLEAGGEEGAIGSAEGVAIAP
jgi:hypothetical protein